ncbi:hypothetical protein [Massilia genomosp. 1]|uniref:hypothetical protein n=1 Tax=Massilia genomosp. 1 TaxID=2609280 RepID=UPI001423E650|nr:hypothetical protein [Massilia genomosp. 1]
MTMILRDRLDTLKTDLEQFFDGAFVREDEEQQANRAAQASRSMPQAAECRRDRRQ